MGKIHRLLIGAVLLHASPSAAQLTTGYDPLLTEPGMQGVRVHPGALAPNVRKWYLPQSLYYEHRWRSWEYSNYARDQYQRYVGTLLEGTRQYDPLGNYISRGWTIYDWTETNPLSFGSAIKKAPQYGSWFNSILISSASKGQFHMTVTIGDAIRTTMTPLTFSKPAFNGIQWDFLTDKYAFTFLGSRVNAPAIPVQAIAQAPTTAANTTRFLGFRGVGQVGDFAKVGTTWLNAHHADNELDLEDNSLKGVLTRPQNTGNVETVVIRISDDSPESPGSGAVLFLARVVVDGEVHPEIVPLVEGGVRRGGVLEARGPDAVTLTYDLRNQFGPTDETPTFQDAKRLEFELIVANDYAVEVSSNKQTDRLGGQVFLPVARADGEITDGSNQRFLRFDYGLPTANEVIGFDFELTGHGLDLRSEYVVNSQFRRYPNQNFRKLPVRRELAQAMYVTASYVTYPWFSYAEAFSLDPDYSTTMFMGDSRGEIDYSDERRHLFEFVDDNDDQDRFPDWPRAGQGGQRVFFGETGGLGGEDFEVFPGLDENNDFISDFNQNQNSKPDYVEPFLRYHVDPPEFLFGMDMNNNTIIDRFENDREPDYPYHRDRRGYNAYGGAALSEQVQLTLGRHEMAQISSARESRAHYGLLTMTLDYPGLRIWLLEHAKRVTDDIPDDRIRWIDPDGFVDFRDPLIAQDAFVNSLYMDTRYTRIDNLDINTKVKFEKYFQLGEQKERRNDRSFLGWIARADYRMPLGDTFVFTPKWKSTFRRQVPASLGAPTTSDVEQALFLLGRYSFLDETWVDLGFEASRFQTLGETADRPGTEAAQDLTSFVVAVLFSNSSAYLGYHVTLNTGFQFERQLFEDVTRRESAVFMRFYASSGGR